MYCSLRVMYAVYAIWFCLIFSGALPISSGAFGDDTVSTVIQSVNCYGNETEVLNCPTADLGTCTEHSASVMCQG